MLLALNYVNFNFIIEGYISWIIPCNVAILINAIGSRILINFFFIFVVQVMSQSQTQTNPDVGVESESGSTVVRRSQSRKR